MDDSDSRMMCLHIPALLPQNLSVEISLPVQSAAVIGAGLLYQGTQNRLITEMLLAQIARKPTCDKMIEREGYALASGIALGFVNLASGTSVVTAASQKVPNLGPQQPSSSSGNLSDLQLDERLIRFVEGGKNLELPRSMLSTTQNSETQKSSAIKENDMVNIYITSSGALISLALIHLKSNNESIAKRLEVPSTFYQMEGVRPDLLLQKILCRNLIMWDQIEATSSWMSSQIPSIISTIYNSQIGEVDK